MTQEQVAVIQGPKGKAEIIEVVVDRAMEYWVTFAGHNEVCKSLGEAYIIAGANLGTKVLVSGLH